MKKHSILALISAAVMAVAATSCDDYLDVNKNVDAPDYVPAYLYLPSIQQNMQGFYWDIRALGPLTQMMGTTSYTNYAAQYYSAASDAAGEVWRVVYWNQGMNLENLINQSLEAENWTMAGIGFMLLFKNGLRRVLNSSKRKTIATMALQSRATTTFSMATRTNGLSGATQSS